MLSVSPSHTYFAQHNAAQHNDTPPSPAPLRHAHLPGHRRGPPGRRLGRLRPVRPRGQRPGPAAVVGPDPARGLPALGLPRALAGQPLLRHGLLLLPHQRAQAHTPSSWAASASARAWRLWPVSGSTSASCGRRPSPRFCSGPRWRRCPSGLTQLILIYHLNTAFGIPDEAFMFGDSVVLTGAWVVGWKKEPKHVILID